MPIGRVAFLLPDLSGGGAENMIIRLAGGMVRRGLQAHLILGRVAGPYLARLPRGVIIHDLGGGLLMAKIPRIARILARIRCDGLIATLPHANLAAALATFLNGQRQVLILREANDPIIASRHAQGWSKRLAYRLIPLTHRLADSVVCISRGVAESLRTGFGVPAYKLRVIYNPALDEDTQRTAAETPEHAWCGDGGPPVFIAVGRLETQKGFDVLIRAFALIAQRRPLRLLILGEGPLRGELEAQVRAAGLSDRVAMPGFVSNTLACMHRANVFVLSSRWEGLGNVVIEALAAGTRVVATDCRSGPREILADGQFGTLVAVDDAAALGAAMLAALAHDPGDPVHLPLHLAQFTVEHAVTAYVHALNSHALNSHA